MELRHWNVIGILTIWMFVAFAVNKVESQGTCKAITLQDIQDAASLSQTIYETAYRHGDKVKGAPQYTVVKVISKVHRAQPLKVVIAKKYPSTTMICFMGTKTPEQLFQQFQSGLAEKKLTLTFKGKQVRVMSYFWEALQLLQVDKSLAVSPNTKYIVTGHSLGGSLASLFSIYMTGIKDGALWKNAGSTLITFGAPRVGLQDYADLHDKLIPAYRKVRLVYNRDLAAHIPYQFLSYRHTSREIWIQKKTERKMYWVKCGWVKCPRWSTVTVVVWHVCPKGDGNGCSNSRRGILLYSVRDHNMGNYIGAIKALRGDANKAKKFIGDQC